LTAADPSTERARWTRRLRPPLLDGLAGYRLAWLPSDVAAGLAIAAVGLPSAIAYPAIAGLPPETGIYASIAAAFAYAALGPSPKLIVGPDAATMTVLAGAVAAAVAAEPAAGPAERATAAAVIAALVGVWCLVARAVGLGALASFLSRPILAGFFVGVSLSILVGQIGRVTGVPIDADGLVAPLVEFAREAGAIHRPTLALAVASFATLEAARRWRSPVPGPVIVVVAAGALSWALDLGARGVAVVGEVPAGLPALGLPHFAGLPLDRVLVGSLAVFLVSFGAGIVTARSFGALAGHRVDPGAELAGFGAANLAAAAAGGFPVTSSDSRTAVNLSVGKTQVAGIVSGAALIATLLFLNPALRVLPVPALGAILVSAALSLIDPAALREVWRISRAEFAFALIALAGAASFGVLAGVGVAVGATLVLLLRRSMQPRVALLGRIPGRPGFYKLHRAPAARPAPGVMLAVVEGDLLFFNADAVDGRLRGLVAAADPRPSRLVIDAGAMAQIDVTGAMTLRDLGTELARTGVSLALAETHADARAILARAGALAPAGPVAVFDTLDEAAAAPLPAVTQ
jgi:high affinity sulfate transporter 1